MGLRVAVDGNPRVGVGQWVGVAVLVQVGLAVRAVVWVGVGDEVAVGERVGEIVFVRVTGRVKVSNAASAVEDGIWDCGEQAARKSRRRINREFGKNVPRWRFETDPGL